MAAMTKAQTAKSVLGQMVSKVKMAKMPEPPKPSKKAGMAMPMSGSYPPSLYLNSDQAPFIKDWQVGDEVTVLLKGKVESVSSREEEKGKAMVSADLRITKATGVLGK